MSNKLIEATVEFLSRDTSTKFSSKEQGVKEDVEELEELEEVDDSSVYARFKRLKDLEKNDPPLQSLIANDEKRRAQRAKERQDLYKATVKAQDRDNAKAEKARLYHGNDEK